MLCSACRAEEASAHLALAARATEDMMLKLSVVDDDMDATEFVITVIVVGIHVGRIHVAVADKTQVAAAIDVVAEGAAVVCHHDIHAVWRGVEGCKTFRCEEVFVIIVTVAGAEDMLIEAAVDGYLGCLHLAVEVVAAIDGVDIVGQVVGQRSAVKQTLRQSRDIRRHTAKVYGWNLRGVGIVERDIGVATDVA